MKLITLKSIVLKPARIFLNAILIALMVLLVFLLGFFMLFISSPLDSYLGTPFHHISTQIGIVFLLEFLIVISSFIVLFIVSEIYNRYRYFIDYYTAEDKGEFMFKYAKKRSEKNVNKMNNFITALENFRDGE